MGRRPAGRRRGQPPARPAVRRPARSRIGDQTGGRVGFFLATDDFTDDHARLVAAGGRFAEQARCEADGRVAVFEDPFGNRWDLLEGA